jgi:hypothetical protein
MEFGGRTPEYFFKIHSLAILEKKPEPGAFFDLQKKASLRRGNKSIGQTRPGDEKYAIHN